MIGNTEIDKYHFDLSPEFNFLLQVAKVRSYFMP